MIGYQKNSNKLSALAWARLPWIILGHFNVMCKEHKTQFASTHVLLMKLLDLPSTSVEAAKP